MTINDIYKFWFGDDQAPRPMWFKKDDEVDREIARRFVPALEAPPAVGDSPRDRVAEIVLFDQFPRNAFRGQARSFAYDARALALAKAAIAKGDLDALSTLEALFVLLPLEHAESLEDQRACVGYFEKSSARAPAGLKAFADEVLDFARRHERIIARFGRFPHRNAILGRDSTAEEVNFLKQPGSGF